MEQYQVNLEARKYTQYRENNIISIIDLRIEYLITSKLTLAHSKKIHGLNELC